MEFEWTPIGDRSHPVTYKITDAHRASVTRLADGRAAWKVEQLGASEALAKGTAESVEAGQAEGDRVLRKVERRPPAPSLGAVCESCGKSISADDIAFVDGGEVTCYGCVRPL